MDEANKNNISNNELSSKTENTQQYTEQDGFATLEDLFKKIIWGIFVKGIWQIFILGIMLRILRITQIILKFIFCTLLWNFCKLVYKNRTKIAKFIYKTFLFGGAYAF